MPAHSSTFLEGKEECLVKSQPHPTSGTLKSNLESIDTRDEGWRVVHNSIVMNCLGVQNTFTEESLNDWGWETVQASPKAYKYIPQKWSHRKMCWYQHKQSVSCLVEAKAWNIDFRPTQRRTKG